MATQPCHSEKLPFEIVGVSVGKSRGYQLFTKLCKNSGVKGRDTCWAGLPHPAPSI